jgi:hypothetical protein
MVHELSFLVGPLASAAYSVDFRLAERYGSEALALFHEATGLENAARLGSVLGPKTALAEGVARAAAERRRAGGATEQATTRELFEMFFQCALSLSGVFGVCLDAAGLSEVMAALEPLSELGDSHAAPWIHRYAGHLKEVCQGRYSAAEAGLWGIARTFEAPSAPNLAKASRRLLLGGTYFTLGALALLRPGGGALECADRLEALDTDFYGLVADQLRVVHFAHRGAAERARTFRDRIDARPSSQRPAWQVELWEVPAMLLVHVRENDVMGLKVAAERLDRLAGEVPSFGRLATIARAAHLRLRGELGPAEALLEGILADAPAARFLGLATAVGLLAEIYNTNGEFERAERITRELSAHISDEDRRFSRTTLPAQIQHAHAVAALGDPAAARTELEVLTAEHAPDDPVTLGLLHRGQAQLALAAGDVARFDAHLAAMEGLFRPTENPALVSLCERLRHELRRSKTARSGEYRMHPDDVVSPARRSRGD